MTTVNAKEMLSPNCKVLKKLALTWAAQMIEKDQINNLKM